MSLPTLPLQAMLLIPITWVTMCRLARMRRMHLNVLLILLYRIFVHLIQDTGTEPNIAKQLITPALAKILSNHHSQHLQVLCLWRHGVGWDDPRALAELMSKGEFVVVFVSLRVDAEGNKGESGAVLLGHDDEAKLFEGVGEVVSSVGEVRHDGAITVLAEADELVVLTDDLGGTFGKVKGEGSLVSSEVVDIEDELFREVFGGSPDDPAYTGVNESILVTTGVDRHNLLESEIPLKFRYNERSYKSTTGSINVNDRIDILLDQQIIDSLSIFVLPSICCAKNDTDTNRVLIHKLDSLLRINDVSLRRAVNILLLDLEVSGGLLPADLDGR